LRFLKIVILKVFREKKLAFKTGFQDHFPERKRLEEGEVVSRAQGISSLSPSKSF